MFQTAWWRRLWSKIMHSTCWCRNWWHKNMCQWLLTCWRIWLWLACHSNHSCRASWDMVLLLHVVENWRKVGGLVCTCCVGIKRITCTIPLNVIIFDEQFQYSGKCQLRLAVTLVGTTHPLSEPHDVQFQGQRPCLMLIHTDIHCQSSAKSGAPVGLHTCLRVQSRIGLQ